MQLETLWYCKRPTKGRKLQIYWALAAIIADSWYTSTTTMNISLNEYLPSVVGFSAVERFFSARVSRSSTTYYELGRRLP